MLSFNERESLCESRFQKIGECWHFWTSDNHPIIFTSQEDFAAGMTIMAIVARLVPEVKLLTFELMSNHIHMVLVGSETESEHFFTLFKKLLSNYFRGGRYSEKRSQLGRVIDLSKFLCSKRKIESLTELRNVIVYDNRNGYIVSPDETPFSYPWGANRYYFNPDAKQLAEDTPEILTLKERIAVIRSHVADKIDPLIKVHGYACPMDFCDIPAGEGMFRDASHYFYSISKNIENHASVAREIMEKVFYTDDELFGAIHSQSLRLYKKRISELDKNEKLELARSMHFDYNASNKQVARILKLPIGVVDTVFP